MAQALFGHYKFTPTSLTSFPCQLPFHSQTSLCTSYLTLFSPPHTQAFVRNLKPQSSVSSFFTPTDKTECTLCSVFPSPVSSETLRALALKTHSLYHMSAIVCHGLQSHLESQLVESRTLMFRLPSSTKPLPPQPIDLSFKSRYWDSNIKTQYEEEENNNNDNNKTDKPIISSNTNTGGWSFLEAFSNVTKEPSQKAEGTYVHPQQKRSSLLLSPKSLELCTENLGSESGTDIVENDIDVLCSSLESAGGDSGTGELGQQQARQHCAASKKAKTLNFPPPLTTIRGPESLRVRPHREDGRLVIEVTRVPPSASCFQAERSNGRLRLCFLKNHTTCFDPEGDDFDTEDNEPSTNEGFEEEFESDVTGQVQDSVEEEDEEEVEERETEEEAEAEEEGDFACGCDMREWNTLRLRCQEGATKVVTMKAMSCC